MSTYTVVCIRSMQCGIKTFIFLWMEKAKKIIVKLQTKQDRCRLIVYRLWKNKNIMGNVLENFLVCDTYSVAHVIIEKTLNNQN